MKGKDKLPSDMIDEFKNVYFEKDGNVYSLLDIPPNLDFLHFAQEYDRKCAEKRRKKRILKSLQLVAMLVICLTTVSVITLETSDAFRVRVYHLFKDEKQGGVALFTQDEYDLINDWEDYWYPSFMPEGYTMIEAEKDDFEKVMLFRSDDGVEIRIREYSLESRISMDTDHTEMADVRIGYYKGHLFTRNDGPYMSVYWMVDDRQLSIKMSGKQDKDLLLQIAEGMKYRE